MWQVYWTARRVVGSSLVAIFMIPALPAASQVFNPNNSTYYNTNTYTHGLHLPSINIPHGADEVRAADGTTCRSSMASNDGYLDMGAIGGQDPARDQTNASVYGRLVVPLGHKPRRLDCTTLYRLEVQRLENEIEMTRIGANNVRAMDPNSSATQNQNWSQEGWYDHRATDRNWRSGTSVAPK